MARSVIQTGSQFRIYSDSVKTHMKLPTGTYRVGHSEMAGHWLEAAEPLTASSEKAYGNQDARVERLARTFKAMKRSHGVLLSGSGGMGKTMLMRALVARVAAENDLPVILVDSDSEGLTPFLDSVGEAVMVFDEFEKVFPDQRGNSDSRQAQFLSLFDGLSQDKRMYIVTVNDLHRLNKYMQNRTGRFHNHLRFTHPEPGDIHEYLVDAGVSETEAEKVVQFSYQLPLNYDHLRAIAFELVQVGGTFEEFIGDMNIKRGINNSGVEYTATIVGESQSFSEDELTPMPNGKFHVESHKDFYAQATVDSTKMHRSAAGWVGDDSCLSMGEATKEILGMIKSVSLTRQSETSMDYS